MSHRRHTPVALWIFAFFTFLMFPALVRAQTSGLVGAYAFNETSGTSVTDASGNNNTGTLGSGVARTTSGKFGGALVFNGTSGLVTIPNSGSLQLTTGMTLEAWVNPSVVTNKWRDVIYKGNDNYYLEATSSKQGLPAAGGTFKNPELYGTAALAANTWTHLAVTYDRVTLRLYVNGVQVSSLAATAAIATSTNPLQIGGDSLYGQFFQGMIDEVRVYNVALTAAQIQADMNTPVGGTPPPDTTGPAVAITSHTNNQTVTTSPITVSGTATDSGLGNNGISSVTVNGVAASGGTATGSATANWSQSITLNPGANTITVVAKDNSTNQNSTTTSITVNYNSSAPDTTGPSVVINSPSNNATVTTSPITVSGTASDLGLGNNGISSVTVNGIAATGGTATGSATANWSQSISLNSGANIITVVGKDNSTNQNSTTVSITVNYNPSSPDTTGPAVAITSHTNGQTVTTSPITVAGTASDSGLGNNGISSVTVNGIAASGGTATGSATANWSRSVTLNPGANTITVVAKDASTAQNSTTVQITVNFNAPDTTGPAVAITSHTNNQTVTTSPITVSGTASDSGLGNNGISSVTVNGIAATGGTATGSATANWSQSVTLNPGANTITVVAKDNSTNQNSTTVSITVTYSATQTPGLVAAYGFNETSGTTVTDVSGSNNNGTFGSGVTRTTSGKIGGALVFNGTNGLVSIPNSASLQLTTGITLEAWVNPSTVSGGWQDVIYKGNDNYYLEGGSSNGGRPAAGGTFGTTYGTAVLTANTWTHLAVTYDRVTLRLYVNGVQVSSLAATAAITTSTNPLQIGGDSLFGQFFQGMIDEVRVYNAALTAAQIQADMNTPVGGTPPLDTTGPSVVINSPSNNATVTTSPITVSGTASDLGLGNNGISSVTVNGIAASGGTATGSATANWSQSISLNPGANTITVVAKDNSTNQNSTTTSITVNYNSSAPDTTGPSVVINSPSNNATVTTSPITVSGTASDSGLGNNGISSVTVNGIAATGGTATGSGTANWSQSIALNSGANTITVVAKDASTNQNSTTVQIAVTYNPSAPDTTGPAVAITSHTNNQTVTTSPITVSGTASDSGLGNNGISSVTVNGVAASGGTATGSATANWSQSVTLNPGANTITVVAKDASTAQNSTTVSITVTYSATQTPGLVAAYGFNETSGTTVTDVSGNNNNGTFGSGVKRTTAGKFGGALVFNGTSGLVTIPNSGSLQLTTGMTLEAWVNPSTVNGGWQDVIYKGNDNYYLEGGSSNGGRPAAGGTFGTTYGTAALAANTWTHLAVTYDRVTLRLYVNGVQVSSLAATAAIATSTNPLQIGGDSLYGQFFQGMIDEVRVYNRALTPPEIQSDVITPVGNGGTPPPGDSGPPNVAITTPASGSTVFSLFQVSADASDDVGVAGVQFLLDGQLLGAEATTAPYSIIWDTTSTASGNHVLTALARDFAGNTKISAPVSVTVIPTTPDLVGQWGLPLNWPIVAVHVNLLPTGEILAWDGQTAGTNARLFNPATNTFTSVNITTGTNIFCTGHCHLPDGRILVTGGHVGAAHVGVVDVNIFNPANRQWTRVASMHTPRWYPTNTTLPDGRILVTAGEINCDACNALIPEIYNPLTNTWTELLGAPLDLTYYPHMFVLPDGRVLAASTAESPTVTQVLNVVTQTWSVVDANAVDGGSAAMYLPGKIMKSGTSTNPDDPVVPSETTTYVLDMTQAAAAWRETAPMAFPRTYHTLTILPDGNVLVTGGGPTTDPVGVNDAVKPAEMWSPVTETWTTMASMQKPRLYHSTALLLPDARVWVAGGGRFGGVNEPTDQLSSEIYSPPYLFKGTRPVITSAPVQIGYGGAITVQTPDVSRIASVSLIKLGSMTHAFNMDQRYVPLSFTAGASSLSVQTPANSNLAPPGHYMLFIVDIDGVPSVATILNIQ